mmetsp:Transcript_17690/g.35664  ORF Transcript_17690/g.35664 Transcript_17690/m.35664 type:complete len:150 (-) Transcript_17690:316-765(-)|eukprot:CAMPEP_0174727060 /NCGR_PEP_ID=MMETSP1094-20130205/48975_1 /TAXON_ID=156173 /ORGANISM="Chrysochromulina brevifilum, Strain UTEX LB 985" /LENGTH=149 /DNA_ID=CAMNT_0015928723 /DNA_START=67 /DNA_END=516 /DNA_ORIENTATION=+
MAAKLDPAKKDALGDVFSMLDRNGSGVVELKELQFLLNKLLNRSIDELTMGEIMSEITDSDKAGTEIDFDMFCNFMAPVLDLPKDEQEKRGFNIMDVDGSGCISVEELRPFMSAVAGSKATVEEANEILKFTAGDDGKIRFPSYVKAIQ